MLLLLLEQQWPLIASWRSARAATRLSARLGFDVRGG